LNARSVNIIIEEPQMNKIIKSVISIASIVFISVIFFHGKSILRKDHMNQFASTTPDDLIKWEHTLTEIQKPDNKIFSVEQLLERLAKTTTLTSNYTLLYDSRSLQDASFAFPRVITFGIDAKIMLAFNGHPSQAGYNSLEVMKFNDQNKTFELREIQFPQDRVRSPAQENAVKVSNINPGKCIVCHGTNPRPNWDTYPFWPGVYGSEDDELFDNVGYYKKQNDNNTEVRKYNEFLRTNRHLGRYAKLADMPGRKLPDGRYSFLNINANLTNLLLPLNLQRISAELNKHNAILNLRSSILDILPDKIPSEETQPDFNSFPSEYRAILAATFKTKYQETRQLQKDSLRYRVARHLELVDTFMGPRFTSGDYSVALSLFNKPLEEGRGGSGVEYYKTHQDYSLAIMRTVAESFGIQTKNWSQEFVPRNYVFQDANIDFLQFKRFWQEVSLSKNSGIDENFGVLPKYNKQLISLVLQKCNVCHSGGANGAPAIPFYNAKKLQAFFQNDKKLLPHLMRRIHLDISDKSHMPPREKLTAVQINALHLYIQSIVESETNL
jgi:hypothetical protein